MSKVQATGPIRVVVVDDHTIIRDGLRAVLAVEPRIQVVGAYASGEALLEHLEQDKPDVLLLDLRLPGMDGLQTLAAVRAARPSTHVLMLSSQDGNENIYKALKMGAVGYVLKVEPSERLIQAIKDAATGATSLSAEVSSQLARRLQGDTITPREIEILEHIADGMSNQDIADTLGLSHNTVKNHIVSIMEKLGANDRTHAVTLALMRGIIVLS